MQDSINISNEICGSRGRDKLKEELNDDEKLEEVRTTLDRDIKFFDCKENLNKKLVANENIKENVATPALDKTHTKSSNVIDCKDDILKNVINITDKKSFQDDDGHD